MQSTVDVAAGFEFFAKNAVGQPVAGPEIPTRNCKRRGIGLCEAVSAGVVDAHRVMTEALATMLGFGFTRLGLHSVEAQIHPANTGSRRVLEKLGFAQEGYFRENYYDIVEAGFTDTAVFSLLKVSWMSRVEA